MLSILAWVLLPLTFSDMQFDKYEMPELKIHQGFRDDHMPQFQLTGAKNCLM